MLGVAVTAGELVAAGPEEAGEPAGELAGKTPVGLVGEPVGETML